MTDDTRPSEGDSADPRPAPVSPRVSGQTDAAQHPVTSASGETPVPPYAAHLPAGAGVGAYAGPTAAYGGPVGGYAGPTLGGYAGGPQQEYPGAPPTWGPAAAVPATPKAPVLGILALTLAIFGVLIVFVPFFGPLFAWVFFASAVVLAIVALVRRGPGKGMAIWALVLSVVGGLTTGTGAIGAILVGGLFAGSAAGPDYYDEAPAPDATYPVEENTLSPALIAPDFPIMGNPRTEPIALGTTLTLADADSSGGEVDDAGTGSWNFTVRPMEDVTATAAAAEVMPPANGALLAVPIEMTNLTGEAVDLSVAYNAIPTSWLVTGDGGTAEQAYLSPLDYPTSWDVEVVEPGATTTFYQVYDVAPEVATTGLIATLFSSGQTLYWRAAG